MTLCEFVGAVGLVFGVTGTVLGVLNYLRDRARIDVWLQWDMEVTPGTEYDHRNPWGVISITNAGRRATYISHVALRVPKELGGVSERSRLSPPTRRTEESSRLLDAAPSIRLAAAPDSLRDEREPCRVRCGAEERLPLHGADRGVRRAQPEAVGSAADHSQS